MATSSEAPNPTPLVDPIRKFVLYTNAKCGGTTLKSWFLANLDLPGLERRPYAFLRAFGPRFALRYARSGRELLPRGAAQDDPEMVRRAINFYRSAYRAPALGSGAADGFFAVAVVRRPEDRIVSAYLDKLCGDDRGQSWVREVSNRRPDMTFVQFLDYLGTADEDGMNPHWRRQTYILNGRRIDAYVRIERLAEDFAAVSGRIGGDPDARLGRRMQGVRHAPKEEAVAGDFPHMGASEIASWRAAHGSFPPKQAFLTEATLPRIRRIYAKDYALPPYAAG